MYTVHATQKLRDRVKAVVEDPVAEPTSALGNWYATGPFWRPQVVLLLNAETLVAVLMPLAPSRTLLTRFPEHMGQVLEALGTDPGFVADEVAATVDGRYAKTASRSLTGVMNEFIFLSERRRRRQGIEDLLVLSTALAHVPCTPLYQSHTYPDRELAALVERHTGSLREPRPT